MLSQNMTDKIIDYIMSHGGDFAEVFAEHVFSSLTCYIQTF